MTINTIRYQVLASPRASFADRVASVLSQASQPGKNLIPVRLVIFGNPANSETYRKEFAYIKQAISACFGNRAPAFSYLAQPPVGTGMFAELHLLEYHNESLFFGTFETVPYVTVTTPFSKELFVGGFMASDYTLPVSAQAKEIFAQIAGCLQSEEMPVWSIIRQWNYIEKITQTDSNGIQHYQAFNDARSAFYSTAPWHGGYPAATGIGTTCGGVVIDLEATLSFSDQIVARAIDNKLQISAHAYSQKVLHGKADVPGCGKSTPKFERAKAWMDSEKQRLYISGTAAIRGELSIGTDNVTEQTRITLENMEFLARQANPEAAESAEPPFTLLRIYLKDPAFRNKVETVLESHYNGVPAIWVTADVCRDELLVEIEGMSR